MNLFLYLLAMTYFSLVSLNLANASDPYQETESIASSSHSEYNALLTPILPPSGYKSTSLIQINAANDAQPIVKWIEQDLFGTPARSTKCIQFMDRFGVFSGLARGTVFFKLGYDFGMRLLPDAATGSQVTVSSLYGIGVYVPMAILGTSISSNLFKKLVTKKTNTQALIEIQTNPYGEYVAKTIAISAGILSAPPMTYLAYKKLEPIIGWFWIIPGSSTFYVRTAIDYFSLMSISTKIYNAVKTPVCRRLTRSHPGSREALIIRIRDDFQNAYSFISSLSEPQTNLLLSTITSKGNAKDKFKLLAKPETIIRDGVHVEKSSWAEEIVSFAGGMVGGYGMWVYYPVAEEAFRSILPWFGIEPTDEVVQGFAKVSTLGAASLTALATHSSTRKFYHAASKVGRYFSSWCGTPLPETLHVPQYGSKRRIGAAVVSSVFAACNAGMQGEVALEFLDLSQLGPRLELTAAIIASFSTCFWAVDEALLAYLKQGDLRASLLGKVDKIIQTLPKMNDDSLRSIINLLHPSYENV